MEKNDGGMWILRGHNAGKTRLAARFYVPAEDLRIYRLLLLTHEKEPQGSLHKSSSQVN
jgi:hypothetical protein